MKIPKIIVDFTRGAIGIFAAMYSANLFPMYYNNHCARGFGYVPEPGAYFVGEFDCSAWPMFLWGLLFVTLCLIIGPKRKGYYLLVAFLFLFLSIMDNLRIGVSFINSMLLIPIQYFFHGGIVALGFIAVSYYYINKDNEVNCT